MEKITIIGGSGFLGTCLVRRLAKSNYRLEIVDKRLGEEFPEITQIADVRIPAELDDKISDASILINLAAEHRDDVHPRSLYHDVNVVGAENICTIAREKNIKQIIFTSTVAVYGFTSKPTGEDGIINPFNDYGRTKYEAEKIYRKWQAEDPNQRTLVIIRPTVIFGEQNRGNVFNLFSQISSKRFVMVGNGKNVKSMAYVQNVAAFISHTLSNGSGQHTYNYADKPDFSMNELILRVRKVLGRPARVGLRIPYILGYCGGLLFDMLNFFKKKNHMISSIRVKKFCSNTVFNTAAGQTGFIAPFTLEDAIERTVTYEFLEDHEHEKKFYSE